MITMVGGEEVHSVDGALMKLSAPPFPISEESARRWLSANRHLIATPMRAVADLATEALNHYNTDRRELAAAAYLVAADLLEQESYLAVAEEYRACAWWLAPKERERRGVPSILRDARESEDATRRDRAVPGGDGNG